jgi:hypothetical protein
MPLKKATSSRKSDKIAKTKKMKTGGAVKGRMGPVATVKKRDGNTPVKIY